MTHDVSRALTFQEMEAISRSLIQEEGSGWSFMVFPSARTDRLQWKGLEIGFAGRQRAKATVGQRQRDMP